MSQWNLSVKLTGQGSGLANTLRDLAADARNASNEVNALRRNLDLLRADASNNIRVRLDLDADHLRADVRAALTAAGSGDGLNVNLNLTDPMQLRRDVANAVRWAAWGHRIEIPLVIRDPNSLRNQVSAAVRRAQQNQTVRIRVTADTSDLRNVTRGLNNRGGGGGSGNKADFSLKSFLPFAPAAIPLVAGLSAQLAPLAAQFAAAGVAGAAFGIAVAGQIGPLGDAADAEEKYQKAVVQHGESSKEALQAQQAYQQLIEQMPPATQQAAIALSTLKTNFSNWSNSMAQFTMVPVTRGIALLDTLIPRLTPEVQSASLQLSRLMAVAGGAISTPGFDHLADRIASFTDSKLNDLTNQVIHLMRVISSGDADHGVIASFVDYARANGPAAREAIQAIAKAVIVLMEGAAQAGPSLLTLVTAAAKLVAALPPELVGIILHVAAALKLLQLSGAGMAALAGGLARVRTQITALAAASAGAGGGLAGLRAAFMSLGVAARTTIVVAGIGALLMVLKGLSDMGKKAPPDVDKLTTSLGKLGQTGKTSGEAARAFGKDFSGLADSLRTLSRPSNLDKTQQFLTKLVGMDSTPVADAKKDLDAVDKSLANLVQGGKADIAGAAFDRIAAAMRKQGMSGKELRSQLDNYKSALADQAFEQELAAQSMGVFGQAAQDTQAKLDAQKKSADGLRQSIMALNDANRQGAGAMNAFEQSIDDASKAAKDNAGALKMHNGELDLGSQKARDAESALRDLAANTDDAAAKAREQGKSWEYVQGILSRGQNAFVETAQKMGLTKSQAQALARAYLDIPDKKSTTLEMRTEDAISGLNSVIAAIQKTPNQKSVTVEALTQDAVYMLNDLGFKVERLPDGRFRVIANTSSASAKLAAVQAARDGLKNKTITLSARDRATAAIAAIQAAIAGLRNRTVTITTVRETISRYSTDTKPRPGQGGVSKYADGGIARAADGLFVPGYAPRQDIVPAILSPGEGVLVPETVRKLGATTGLGGPGIIKALNMWGRYGAAMRFADGGIADGVQHFASGGFTYAPTSTMKSASDVQSAYSSSHQAITKDQYNKTLRARANAVDALRAAEAKLNEVRKHKHTHAQLVAAENRVAKARRTLANATDAAKSAEARYKKQFSLADWSKTLSSSVKSSAAYEANLKKIASRGGSDVIDQLRDMGAEGASMVSALAKASSKEFKKIVGDLRKLGPLAKASLADYTAQLNSATTTSKVFQANLAKLAGMGYGDLASQLASQGDEAAQALAAQAVKSKSAAAKANSAAKANAGTLSSDQLSELVQIIAAISSSKVGIHDVAAKTSLGEDEIITVANKAKGQISSSLGSRATKFLADLARANQHLSYADGGIRAGMYATNGGIIRFAEPSTGGEAYLPLAASKRRTAMPVLADVARRFGVGITDVQAGRPLVIVRSGDTINVPVTPVRTGASASDIGAQVGRSVRRARRGGVSARAA